MENLIYQHFSAINLNDPFFDSLKADYSEFSDWFFKKSCQDEGAYVLYDLNSRIEGFMYLKFESGVISDIEPPLTNYRHLKIGTFKFESAGTRRGERFIKKIFDNALESDVEDIYVTVFSKHEYLMHLFKKYGFTTHGSKETQNGTENVLTKYINIDQKDVLKNYPRVDFNSSKYLLAIYPEFHSRMLPDSILNNETHNIIQDVSHSNSIHKIYMCAARDAMLLKRGDSLIIYRTGDGQGPARYRAVISSLCVVEEVKNISYFNSLDEFLDYSLSYSVFTKEELITFYRTKRYPFIIKFTYNTALKVRVNRDRLLNEVGLTEDRIVVMEISDDKFRHMLQLGEVNERFIIN